MTLVNWLLAASVSTAMFYTGLLFDPAWARRDFLRGKLRPFAGLACINYLAVPLLAFAMIKLLPVNATLALTFMTLAALPCAPLVPALVTTLASEPPEWPLAVFIGFSALSLLVVFALIAFMAHSVTYAGNIGADTATKLCHYVLIVYGPMAIGTLLRFRTPERARRWLGPVRRLAGIAIVVFLVLFAATHRSEFAAIGRVEFLLVCAFILSCSLLGALPSRRLAGSRLTSTISTAFRNIALGIAFTTVVLRRPDVTAYLVVYSAVTLPLCALFLLAARLHRRTAHD